jgi:hypothetical protein
MAEPTLKTTVSVDVRPSEASLAALSRTQTKLAQIEAQAKSAIGASRAAAGVALLPGGGGVRNDLNGPTSLADGPLVGKRSLAAMAEMRNSGGDVKSALGVTGGGLKVGAIGTLGANGFTINRSVIGKVAMPLLYAAGGTRAAAGGLNALSSVIERFQQESVSQALGGIAKSTVMGIVGMTGAEQIADAIVRLNRTSGSSRIMTIGQMEQEQEKSAEHRAKVAEETSRYDEMIRGQLASQSSGLVSSWLGRPDSYKLISRLGQTLEERATDATKRKENAIAVAVFNAGTSY